MKVKVVGSVHREGISKKNNRPFNACFVSVTYPARGYTGVKAQELYIPMETLGGVIPQPGEEYDLEYDSQGYIVAFTPSVMFGNGTTK